MTGRRTFMLGVLGAGCIPAIAAADGVSGAISARRAGGAPTMIKGRPNKLDFGGGLVVPMDGSIFGVLWEGRDRWITYGRGVGPNRGKAMGLAQRAADGTMQLMLLTLAFEPDRLEKIEGSGWRLKSRNTADLVLGKVALPGKPLMPTTDSFGNDGSSSSADTDQGFDPATGTLVHALTGFIVLKKDADLAYVRQHGQRLSEAQAREAARQAPG